MLEVTVKLHVQSSPYFLCMLPTGVARSLYYYYCCRYYFFIIIIIIIYYTIR